ncbi:MAG: aerotolerance regulator BatA [Treponema sp. GWB1_62_6]|nr:MAG: aerotolerance regulator BatA [Treponema sp. GWC1_61_84]OHE67511.1 MAG: aerotolerance regulator BatA [Treponema sp. GWB1_62_6]
MLNLENPFLFAIGALLIVLALVIDRSRRKSGSWALPLGPPGGASFEAPVGAGMAVRAIMAAEILGAFSLLAAASGPRSLSMELVWLERGADIVMVVDASPSMSARDMDGTSRFELAKNLVRDFAAARGADAIGLVGVGSDAALLVPPTIDRKALESRLDSLSIAEFGEGTALGLGLSVAALHLSSSGAKRKAAVLITDGENNAGEIHPATAASILRSTGASLWVIGVGGAGEAEIDYVDPETGRRRRGVFDSRYDQESLAEIARAGGGVFIGAPSAQSFVRAFARVGEEEPTSALWRSRLRATSLHAPFVIAGMILLLLARLSRRYALGAFL